MASLFKVLSTTTYIHHTHRNHGRHRLTYSLHNSKARLPHSLSYKELAFDQIHHKSIKKHWRIKYWKEEEIIKSQFELIRTLQYLSSISLIFYEQSFSKVLINSKENKIC